MFGTLLYSKYFRMTGGDDQGDFFVIGRKENQTMIPLRTIHFLFHLFVSQLMIQKV